MTDVENAIYAIERCTCHVPDACRDCPYDAGHPYNECIEMLLKDVLELLKEQKSEWLEDSDPGQEYGTTWACRKCMHSIHKPFVWNPYDSGMEYCPFCGKRMVVKLDDRV